MNKLVIARLLGPHKPHGVWLSPARCDLVLPKALRVDAFYTICIVPLMSIW